MVNIIFNNAVLKTNKMIRELSLFFCVYSTVSEINHYIWIKDSAFDDVTITDDVISTTSDVTNAVNCGRLCARHPKCKSFSYDVNHECLLYPAMLLNNMSSLPSPGSHYYYLFSGPCPEDEGFVYFGHLQLCFKVFIDNKVTWLEAHNHCRQLGSRLIVLDTYEKHIAVFKYVKEKDDIHPLYIGLTDIVTEGKFVWENSNELTFSQWKPGNPDTTPAGTEKNCVTLRITNSVWRNLSCDKKKGYLCEKPN